MQARSMGEKADNIKPISHFELPESDYDKGAPFLLQDVAMHQELSNYRHNAQEILAAIASDYEHSTPVAVWPHHYDTGSVINVDFDDVGEPVKTVGIGMAIPDSVCGEMYYYVNHWAKDKKISYEGLPQLSNDAKWKTEGFKGAILPMSSIVAQESAEAQCQMVEQFLKEAIDASVTLLDAEPVKV